MKIDLKMMDKYKTIDFKMLSMYLETLYSLFVAKYASIQVHKIGIFTIKSSCKFHSLNVLLIISKTFI